MVLMMLSHWNALAGLKRQGDPLMTEMTLYEVVEAIAIEAVDRWPELTDTPDTAKINKALQVRACVACCGLGHTGVVTAVL